MSVDSEPAPVCGNCRSGMNPREGNEWFCPRCADYGRYLGIVRPESPSHPAFRQALREDPTLAVGCELQLYNPRSDDEYADYIGLVSEYDEESDEYLVIDGLCEPFLEKQFRLDRDRLLSMFCNPEMRNPDLKDEEVFFLL